MMYSTTAPSPRASLRTTERVFAERILNVVSGPNIWGFLALLAVIVIVWISGETQKVNFGAGDALTDLDENDHHFFAAVRKDYIDRNGPMHRCLDPDDDMEKWKHALKKQKCECSDPILPKRRDIEESDAHQQRLKQIANDVDSDGLDLVMVGDSLIELWAGTKRLGREEAPEYRGEFDMYYTAATTKDGHRGQSNQSGATKPTALALGSWGDTSNNLLWRLSNGLMPDNLQPKVWLIMIGTNDMGRTGCSKQNTLSGVLNVARYIHKARPHAKIIIHGLLPRADIQDDPDDEFGLETDYSLGYIWKNILYINRELKKFCNMHDNWIYMDAARLFLEKQERTHDDHDTKGALQINPNMMENALHPTLQGYDEWGKLISDVVGKHLQRKIRDEI